KRQVRLRDAIDRGEAAIVGGAVATERADVVERACLAAHDPIAADQVGMNGAIGLGFENRFVEPRRQRVDQVDVAGELVVLLARDFAGNENSQVADILVDGVDDCLSAGAELIGVFIEIEYPSERLLRRSNIVPLGAEHDDRRANAAQINLKSAGSPDFAGSKIVADEQFIDDELNLLGVQIDVTAPPAFEAE